ncbi:MAG: hypothetical protein AAFX85_15250, partial [Pseudomonadota bacterium]
FWAFLKLVQTVGAISLLANLRPAFGLALVTPVTMVMCLLYAFSLQTFIPVGVLLLASTAVLFHAYRSSFAPLFRDYTVRARRDGLGDASAPAAGS